MKNLFLILIVSLGLNSVYAQINPFEELGYTPKIATLSQGKYNESFDNDTIVQIGSVLFNTKSQQIVTFIKIDTLYSESTLEPDIVSRWMSPDPFMKEYPSQSPYSFIANSPIQFTDPSGSVIIDPKTGEQVIKVNGEWKTASGGKVSKKFIKDSQPVLDKLTATKVGIKIYNQLQSVRTKVKIDLSDKPNLQTLKNGGNSRLRTEDGQFTKGADGLYNNVVITPDLNKIKLSAKDSGIDYDEKLLQTLSVEKDHIISKEQIKKESDYHYQTDTPQKFADVYNQLLNNAIKVGKEYRKETGKPIDKTSNLPIENVKKHPSGIGSKLEITQ